MLSYLAHPLADVFDGFKEITSQTDEYLVNLSSKPYVLKTN